MKCPFCANEDTQVKDSRPSDDGLSIRRRRMCHVCNARFTTLERIHLRDIIVIKKNGGREQLERNKITKSLEMALRKRPVNSDQIEMMVNNIIRNLEETGDTEIPASLIGERIMEALEKLDKVAYVRFASVYRDFCEVKDFEKFIKKLRAE